MLDTKKVALQYKSLAEQWRSGNRGLSSLNKK